MCDYHVLTIVFNRITTKRNKIENYDTVFCEYFRCSYVFFWVCPTIEKTNDSKKKKNLSSAPTRPEMLSNKVTREKFGAGCLVKKINHT